MLKVHDLHFSYGGVKALQGISFDVEKGESIAIIGPNGAGKSTLFECLTGNRAGMRGDIQLDEESILHKSTSAICRLGIGRTFQYPKGFLGLSVIQNVMVSTFLHTSDSEVAHHEALQVLKRVALDHKADKSVSELSLFEKKRLEIAKVIATDAKILLFDEVTSGTRPEEMPSMIALFKDLLNQGKTLLFVEHIMPFVHAVAQRLIVIDHGKKIADGPLKETFNEPAVQKAYFGEDYDPRG